MYQRSRKHLSRKRKPHFHSAHASLWTERFAVTLEECSPAWLGMAHERLDRAVWAAYGWEDDPNETTEDELLTRLLALNKERARS